MATGGADNLVELSRPMSIALACLALLLARGDGDPPSPAEPPLPPPVALIELRAGRASVAQRGSLAALVRGAAPLALAGRAHLSVAAGGEVDLRWSARASLRLFGPAALEWEAPGGDEPLRLSFQALGRADIEVRRGRLRLLLPQDWVADLERGSFALSACATGGAVLAQRAGAPARLFWTGSAADAPPAAILGPGGEARLQGGRRALPRRDPEVGPWAAPRWPWGADGRPRPPARDGLAPPWPAAEWPWGSPAPERTPAWSRVTWPWAEPPSTPGGAASGGDGGPGTAGERSGARDSQGWLFE